MREVVLRVPADAVEDVLDRLLPLVPGGVRAVPRGSMVELKLRGESLPAIDDVIRAAGRWPHTLSEGTVPDDWRERRMLDFRPEVIGDRLVVRPEWAPPARKRMLEIVLAETTAFGSGSHPTTRTCLELLLGVKPAGTFADLGCGTGVLSILAAKLGWRSVVAVDLQPASVEAARANAAANGVAIEARVADLATVPAPAADAIAANVPGAVHLQIAESLPADRPGLALVSGFGPEHSAEVLAAYADRGLHPTVTLEPQGWGPETRLIGSAPHDRSAGGEDHQLDAEAVPEGDHRQSPVKPRDDREGPRQHLLQGEQGADGRCLQPQAPDLGRQGQLLQQARVQRHIPQQVRRGQGLSQDRWNNTGVLLPAVQDLGGTTTSVSLAAGQSTPLGTFPMAGAEQLHRQTFPATGFNQVLTLTVSSESTPSGVSLVGQIVNGAG